MKSIIQRRIPSSYQRSARISSVCRNFGVTSTFDSCTRTTNNTPQIAQLVDTKWNWKFHYTWTSCDNDVAAIQPSLSYCSRNVHHMSIRKNSEQQAGRHRIFWENMLNDLIAYREANDGNTMVPIDYPPNPKLGRWVDSVRQNYRYFQMGKPSLLDEDRIRILEEEGFIWDVYEEMWNQRYKELLNYREIYGTTSVPRTEEFKDLWMWIHVQRRNYVKKTNGEKNSMTDKRMELLNDIGFIFSQHEENWNLRFEELKEYKRHYGDCLVPKKHSNVKLAKWVEMQRTQYKKLERGEHSHLSPERKRKLEGVEFVWDVNDLKWNLKCKELKNFVEMNGHCNIPAKGSHKALKNWVNRQKCEYKKFFEGEKGQLDSNRVELLHQAGLTFV